MPVTATHPDYDRMLPKWTRARDAFDGADAVKEKQTDYLPRLGGMTDATYGAYLTRASFFNNVAPTVVAMIGIVFQKPPRYDRVPDAFLPLLDDVTLGGVSMEQFSRDAVGQVVSPGRYGVLVDMPVGGQNVRPYFVAYRAEEIVNWRTRTIGGAQVPTLVVLRESTHEDGDDEFERVPTTRYRVLRLENPASRPVYTTQTYRQAPDKKDEWVAGPVVIPTRRGMPLPFIPFVPINPEGTSFGTSDPPLMAMIDVNFSHYRTMADLEWALHWTAIPTPIVTGVPSDDPTPMHIGSSETIKLTDPNARAFYMEFSGSGVAALREMDASKREMMAALGARMLERPGAPPTATEVQLRHAGENANLTTVVQSVGQGLSIATRWLVWWASGDQAIDGDLKVELNQEFVTSQIAPDELRAAMQAWQAGAISFRQFFDRLQRGGFYAEGTTVEEELEAIRSESEERMAKALEIAGAQQGEGNDDDEDEDEGDDDAGAGPDQA